MDKSQDKTEVGQGAGVKFDADKPQASLLPGAPLIEVAKVLDHGARKYAPDNWRAGMRYRRLLDATLRHLFAYIDGETYDPDTGLSHAAHAACDLLFLLEMERSHPELDDRYQHELSGDKPPEAQS